jgi:hypothetical protein
MKPMTQVTTVYPEKNEDFIEYKKNVISGGNIYWAISYWSRTNQEHYNKVMIKKGEKYLNNRSVINVEYSEQKNKHNLFELFLKFFKK